MFLHEICIIQNKTNKDKSTEISPPFLKPTDICTCAMPKAKKVSKRFQLLKRGPGFAPLGVITCPSRTNVPDSAIVIQNCTQLDVVLRQTVRVIGKMILITSAVKGTV